MKTTLTLLSFLLVTLELSALSFHPNKKRERGQGGQDRSALRQKKFLRALESLEREHTLRTSDPNDPSSGQPKPEARIPTTPSGAEQTMTIHLLILPVAYQDQSMTLSTSQISNLFFNPENLPPNNYDPQPPYSVEDYFLLMSKKTFQFKGTVLPTIDLASNKRHYADQVQRETGFLDEVADHLESYSQIPGNAFDVSQFDKNNDGYLDILVILHSGQGDETDPQEGSIISHMSSFALKALSDSRFSRQVTATDATTTTNLYLGRYTIVPEFNNTSYQGATLGNGSPLVETQLATIGTICHELGHCLGLVDLYNTDTSSLRSRQDNTIGRTSLMSVGNFNYGSEPNSYYTVGDSLFPITGNRPAPLIGIHKILLGWEDPIVLEDGNQGSYLVGDYSLLNSSNTLYKIVGPSKTQFWLLENRQGSYLDDGLNGTKGLLIWHINEERLGKGSTHFLTDKGIQNDPRRRAVQLEEPGINNPTNNIRNVLQRHFWLNSSSGFTPTSIPNSHYARNNTPSGVFITNIFPSANTPTSNMSFSLSMTPVAGYTEEAVSYPSPFVAGNGALMRIRVRANNKLKQFPNNLLLKIISRRGKVIQTFNALHNTIFFEDNFKALTVNWDGKDSKGNPAPIGVYYYLITHDEFHFIVGRFLLLR